MYKRQVYDGGKRCCKVRPLFMRGLAERVGRWVALPAWIDEVADIGVAEREEVERWKRTSCSVSYTHLQREQQRLTDGLIDMVFGFGPLESLLADDSVTEIMVNGPSDVDVYKRQR